MLLPISPRPAAAAAAASAMAKRSRDVDEEGDQGPLFVSDDEGGEGGDDSGPARKGAGAGKAAGGAAGKKRKMTPAARKRAKRRKEKEVALAKGYTTATVFVGQLPYKATAAQLKEYFAHRGILNTKVRLRKDRNTNKSLGTAFIDLEDKHQIPNALRLHHSMFQGRQINVERTVGGGGNSEKRTTKLKMLRDVQQNQSQKDMDELLAITENSYGSYSYMSFGDAAGGWDRDTNAFVGFDEDINAWDVSRVTTMEVSHHRLPPRW